MTKALFSDEGLQALRGFLARPLLCLFDFDGTLAPLLPEPDAVLLPARVNAQLQTLQRRMPVGIVTGRSLADLRQRLGFHPDYLIGNHGLEGVPGCPPRTALPAQVAQWKAQLAPRLLALDPGIWIEDKQYSLSLHYRRARDAGQSAQMLHALLTTLSPPARIIAGKFNYSVLPPEAGDKGLAVQALLATAGIARALYVGDDLTDEDVFRLPDEGLFTIRVGRDAGSAAQWWLEDHPAVGRLLGWLADALHDLPERSSYRAGEGQANGERR